MGVLTGELGMVNGQSSIRNWSVNHTSAPKKFISSATKGAAARRRGVQDWSGNFGAYTAKPLIMPGESFTFLGYTGPTTGVTGTIGDTYGGTALVDSIVVTWNFEAADLISCVTNFGGHLVLTQGTGLATDATMPDVQECIGLTPTVGDSEIPNLTTITLTITAENKTYVNSSTDGWTGRKRGAIDATLAVGVHGSNPDDFVLGLGGDLEFKLPVNDTDFWWLKWMHFKDVTNIQVDPEGQTIIGFTANFEFNGFVDDEYGKIVLPGEVDPWWPF